MSKALSTTSLLATVACIVGGGYISNRVQKMATALAKASRAKVAMYDARAVVIDKLICKTYPQFGDIAHGGFIPTVKDICLDMEDLPGLTHAFSKAGLRLEQATTAAMEAGFQYQLTCGGSFIGIKIFKNIN